MHSKSARKSQENPASYQLYFRLSFSDFFAKECRQNNSGAFSSQIDDSVARSFEKMSMNSRAKYLY